MRKSTKLSKLRDLLEWWADGKQPLRRALPLVVYQVCLCVYSALLNEGKAEFIVSDVCDVLKKCGIESSVQGIGYVAYI